MIVVIPVCPKDEALVLKNLDWIAELDGKIQAKCLIPFPDSFPTPPHCVIEKAKAIFREVEIMTYPEWAGKPDWPQPQNWAWQSTARAVHFAGQPWLWMEADSTPTIKGWYDTIKEEYESGGKPFMGCLMNEPPWDGHMNGVAVYPYNVFSYCQSAALCRSAPFDVFMWKEIAPHTHGANHIIQHHAMKDGDSTRFPDPETVMRIVRPGVVLFHRCKDGTLIDRLRESRPSGWFRKFLSSTPRLPKKKARPLPIICHLDSSSGYGQFSSNIALALKAMDYDVELYPASMNEIHGALLPGVKEMIKKTPSPYDWTFVFFPAVIQPARLTMTTNRVAYMTMFEATRLTRQTLDVLNRCKVVITPSAWCASCFSAYGVNAMIRVAPLGLDLSKWPFEKQKIGDNFVFGTAAKTASGGIRKGFNIVVEAFRRAFPQEKDVRLRVKAFPEDSQIETHGDTRIDQIRTYLDHEQFVAWMQSLNAFASGSASEGWGLIQQQAMALGKPVIGIEFGSVCEFFSDANGYPVDWKLVEGEGIYTGLGHYAKPNVDSMAEQMRKAYLEPRNFKQKCLLSAESARRFTLENSAVKIVEAMREAGFPV